MNCPKCAFFNKEDATICQKCGKKLNVSPEATKKRKRFYFILVTLTVVILVALTLFLIFRDNSSDRPDLVTNMRTYEFTKNFNMVIDAGLYADLLIDVSSEGIFDHDNRTKYYETDGRWFVDSPDEVIDKSEVYVDFAARTTYFRIPDFDGWIRERSAVPLVNLNEYIEAIQGDGEITRIEEGKYRLTISNIRVMEIAAQFAGEILEQIPIEVESFVTLEIRNGFIIKATYDFTEIYRPFGVTNFILTFEFSNHNRADSVEIPNDVIRNSLLLDELLEQVRVCSQAFGCQCPTPTSPVCHCNYNNRATGQVQIVQCPNPNLN